MSDPIPDFSDEHSVRSGAFPENANEEPET
ncbi:MAG: hypothetical protein BMS9Abin01_1326 [Gammaproteobacteria bacterium]|nr:MAG: hypothetical protein BMS9Abin01_1326 [Gammaproteobacteria bacterium]